MARTANKKIKNATPLDYNGIHFRSKLEVSIFKVLEDNGLSPQYEPRKHHIWKGFKPNIPFYIKDKRTKELKLDNTKIIDITYCPDIEFVYKKYIIFVEVKSFENDVFPYKKKLFRKYLEEMANIKDYPYIPIFVQVGTKKEILDFIEILKTDYNEES